MSHSDAFRPYLHELRANLAGGMATEHTYRPALEHLIESLEPGIEATNESARTQCGNVGLDGLLKTTRDGIEAIAALLRRFLAEQQPPAVGQPCELAQRMATLARAEPPGVAALRSTT